MVNIISSYANPHIKHLLQLQQKSALRRREKLFVVEGQREISHCIANGYTLHSVFTLDPTTAPHCDNLYHVTPDLYQRIAYRGTTEGLIAIAYEKVEDQEPMISEAQSHAPLFLVLVSLEKPGNLGALLRTADAAGIDAVIICDPLTDLYNPNLIRASLGAVFTVPCYCCTTDECIAFLNAHHIQILTAQLQDSAPYYDVDMRQPTAIVMGSEATGLTTAWRKAANRHIRIPMLGQMDSLNVSTSAAILVYEAVRQRNNETTK